MVRLLALGLLLLANIAAAQNLVPNPSFEQGLTNPAGGNSAGALASGKTLGGQEKGAFR